MVFLKMTLPTLANQLITHGWWPWWHRAIIGNNHLNIFSFLYYHNYALLSATPRPASTNHTITAQNY